MESDSSSDDEIEQIAMLWIIDQEYHFGFFDDEELSEKEQRAEKYRHLRVRWENHMHMLENSSEQFESHYHMSPASFNKLVSLLYDKIKVNQARSRASTGDNLPILEKIVVADQPD